METYVKVSLWILVAIAVRMFCMELGGDNLPRTLLAFAGIAMSLLAVYLNNKAVSKIQPVPPN